MTALGIVPSVKCIGLNIRMPNYDYRCGVCGHVHELFTTMSDDKLKKCPKCGRRKARRLIGKGNFILKGKGFYNTDYRGGNDVPPVKP